MKSYRYLIVGGGMTADAAARAIREVDSTGSIGIISDDPHPPYNRPPLSKGLWKGDDPEKVVWRGTASGILISDDQAKTEKAVGNAIQDMAKQNRKLRAKEANKKR